MGGYLYLLLKSLVESDAAKKDDVEQLSAFVFGEDGELVFGEDGEFLGRVDVPVPAGR